MEKKGMIEELLMRIHELEYGHAQLRQQMMKLVIHKTFSTTLGTEAYYFNILQSIDEPIHLTDSNGCVVYRNPAWEKFYGYSSAESIGKNVIDLMIKPNDASIAKNIMKQILKGESHSGEFVVRNHKGERFLSFGSSKPFRDENGTVIGIIGISIFPRPYQEIIPEPNVGSPKKLSIDPQQTVIPSMVFNLGQDERFTGTNSDYISGNNKSGIYKIISAKAEWMAKNGIVWPWKGNERKESRFDSRAARLCWHWLQSDQENEYVRQMNSGIPKKVESRPSVDIALGRWCSSFDKLFEIKWEELVIRERIRRGSSWSVYHAVWYGSDVALKLFSKHEYSHDLILSFTREVSIMKKLRHPNILLFMGTIISPHRLCIVTEFLPRGSLFQLLHQYTDRLKWGHRVHMAVDIARGMNYLHRCNPPVVHCDLNSSNLLVDNNWRVKIGDFGHCRIKHETYVSTKEGIGTPQWMAPEVIRDEQADEKSDVYSYGVVLWEFTTEKIPWDGLDSIQVMKAVGFMNQHLDIPKHVDSRWSSLTERCFCSEPKSRPTFQEILDELKAVQKKFAVQVEE